MCHAICSCLLLALFATAQQTTQAPAPSPADLVKQGQKLNAEGKPDEALALYHQALELNAKFYEADVATGMILDLKGDYAEARDHFSKALELAPPEAKQQVLQATAISYAFEGKAEQASGFEVQIFSARSGKDDFTGAAATANELARIYLQSGDVANALKWYKIGYDTALKIPKLTDADQNLWLFRWESAQARITAAGGQTESAQKHVAAAKVALDKANNPDQLRFFPYLTGYVAFYTGDYKTAIADLQKADQHDPMVLALLGEAYEKSGDRKPAQEFYRQAFASPAHNPANAFAHPLARMKLASGS